MSNTFVGIGVDGGSFGPSITSLLFDENFSVDKAATFTGNVAEPTSTGIGTRYWWNAQSGDNISNGVLNFHASTNLILSDAAADRARVAGTCHYLKWKNPATDFQSLWFGLSQSANTNGVMWIFSIPITGCYMHEVSPGVLRNTGSYQSLPAHGNYSQKNVFTGDEDAELMLVERGAAGVMLFYRINSGSWRLFSLETVSTLPGKIKFHNQGAGAALKVYRLASARTTFSPIPIVQHSFESALSPSDGAGQLETGGSGITAETTGSVAVVSNRLAMSADGEGKVVWQAGTTDWVMSLKAQVYDGSPVGVVVRWIDANNYLYVEVDSTNDRIRLYEVVGGSQTTLVTASFNPGSLDTLDLVDGANIELTVKNNGDSIIAVWHPGTLHDAFIQTTSTRFNTATKCGSIVKKRRWCQLVECQKCCGVFRRADASSVLEICSLENVRVIICKTNGSGAG